MGPLFDDSLLDSLLNEPLSDDSTSTSTSTALPDLLLVLALADTNDGGRTRCSISFRLIVIQCLL